jgi:hypothetical protein
MSEVTSPPPHHVPPTCSVTSSDAERAADLRAGDRQSPCKARHRLPEYHQPVARRLVKKTPASASTQAPPHHRAGSRTLGRSFISPVRTRAQFRTLEPQSAECSAEDSPLEQPLLTYSSSGRAVRAFPALARQRRSRRASPPRLSESGPGRLDSVAVSLPQGSKPKRSEKPARRIVSTKDRLLARRHTSIKT